MTRDPYAPGALHHMPLRFDRPFVCRFCGKSDTSTSGNAETCRDCHGGPAHVAWKRRRQAVYARRRAER